MELTKIRNMSDEELLTTEKTAAEQLFRIRFQMATDPSSGAKKLRELRKDIAKIKTIAKERELGIRGAAKDTANDVVAETVPATSSKKGAR